MNQPLTKDSFRNIRTISQCDGRLMAIKYIRTFHAENFEVAKMVFEDIATNKPWTMPRVQADINGCRERNFRKAA